MYQSLRWVALIIQHHAMHGDQQTVSRLTFMFGQLRSRARHCTPSMRLSSLRDCLMIRMREVLRLLRIEAESRSSCARSTAWGSRSERFEGPPSMNERLRSCSSSTMFSKSGLVKVEAKTKESSLL